MIILCFFQAEDGIRDGHVTGVQTCALPILISDANMAIIIITNMTTPNVYIGYLNTRKSNTGSSSFSWRNANNTSASVPTRMGRAAIGAKNPASSPPAELNPNTTPPKPMVENKIDIKSILGFVTSDTLTKNL